MELANDCIEQIAVQLTYLKESEQSFINGYLAGLRYTPSLSNQALPESSDTTFVRGNGNGPFVNSSPNAVRDKYDLNKD